MKTLTSTKFDARIYWQKAKKQAPLSFYGDAYKIWFTPSHIRVGNSSYSHDEWTNFNFEDMPNMPNMPRLEIKFWSKWGLYFSKLLKLYKNKKG